VAVTAPATTRYAKSGDVSIAYQVVGDEGPDLIISPGFVSHVEEIWQLPRLAAPLVRTAEFSRLILYDKREQGLSDRVGRPPTVEEMMDDLTSVLDAVGCERAALFGVSEGGPAAMLFAATHPERCTHLLLWGTYARITRADDYSLGFEDDAFDGWGRLIDEQWGGPVGIELFAPSWAGDAEAEAEWARLLRAGTSPGGARALIGLYRDLDVREALPLISAPTLVMSTAEDRLVPPELGRYVADRIDGARFLEFPGADHLIAALDSDAVLDAAAEFITGTRVTRPPERVLATVLFTDIVDSTKRAAELGDRRWRELLDRHDALVGQEIKAHRGTAIKNTGDGVLATFDGPARAIDCASQIVERVSPLGIEVRAGLHTGECELRNGDVGGLAVHIGARVAGQAAGGEVLVSGTVKDLVVGSGTEFDDRGEAELKGVPGSWRLFAVRA
jgi:class 3 adenylate cyclase